MTLALSKVWSPRPISLSIVEVLERKGAMTDIDLQKELKSNFGEVSFRELNTNLMRLEMAGVLWEDYAGAGCGDGERGELHLDQGTRIVQQVGRRV